MADNTNLKKTTGSGGIRSVTNSPEEIASSTYDNSRSSSATARVANVGHKDTDFRDSGTTNWGTGASRSLYSVFSNASGTEMRDRDLLKSRLWKGVPQLTHDQMDAFRAAYTGHQFFFVVDVPRFMTQGIYRDTNLHAQIRNLKSIIERASTSFSGPSPIMATFDTQDDGAGRKISHMTSVTKEQSDITLRLHEFAGLPVKNAIESWLTGVYDINSQHGHYFGNLGIPGGWCTANHTMSLLVVQTDPSWTEIQDAAFYYNMMPNEVPFDHWNWTKGDSTIVQDADITFNCNEIRNPAIMYAAEKYMNARILSMVETSVFNTRQFVPTEFANTNVGDLAGSTFNAELGEGATIIDRTQYNAVIKNEGVAVDNISLVEQWPTTEYKSKVSYTKEIEPDIKASTKKDENK